jgi:hypothetical protein
MLHLPPPLTRRFKSQIKPREKGSKPDPSPLKWQPPSFGGIDLSDGGNTNYFYR